MQFILPQKLADKNLDELVNRIFNHFKSAPKDNFYFDFTKVEYIGNQELLVLTGIFKIFIASNVNFRLIFIAEGQPIKDINIRIKRQIIQIWEVWKIWQISPHVDYHKYFGLDGNLVSRLQTELNYYPKASEIYTRYGITPFVSLDYINNYYEYEIEQIIDPIYTLNSATIELLSRNGCSHPFATNSLSTIITEELYLNFLDHSIKSSFPGLENYAFMSISFQEKLNEERYSPEEIQKIKGLNFNTEQLAESRAFFVDPKNNQFKNNAYIQFSFVDFGNGIPSTLKSQYQKKHKSLPEKDLDTAILKFAFNYDSSRHPLEVKNAKETVISRGLFDALIIVQRYKGLLVVRSNFGKLMFNFANTDNINAAFTHFNSKQETFFPGTLISLYLPALEDLKSFNKSAIKPEITFNKIKSKDKKYLSINLIGARLHRKKKDLYNELINDLKRRICEEGNHSLVFISFKATEWIDRRILNKTFEFLVSNYEINQFNNVVVLNPPPAEIIDEVSQKLLSLNQAIKNYKIHPLPIVSINADNETVDVKWLGVYDEKDRIKLMDLLYSEFTIAKSDFKDPNNVIGQLNDFDQHQNLLSNFPQQEELLVYLKSTEEEAAKIRILELLKYHQCIKADSDKSLFLCHGNYYQREYIELTNLLNDKYGLAVVSTDLFERIADKVDNIDDYRFIGITTSSHKLLKSMEGQQLIVEEDYITLDNYYNFEQDQNFDEILPDKKYILVCDVISTGTLTERLSNHLNEIGTSLDYVAVVISTLDFEFDKTSPFIRDFGDRLISLLDQPIKKFHADDIKDEIVKKRFIRINPFTNIPITLSIRETGFYESVIFSSKVYLAEKNEIIISNPFLDKIPIESLHIGFLKFNQVIHPYFFDTNIIIPNLSKEILKDIFKKIPNRSLTTDKVKVFYPRKSGISHFRFDTLKEVLHNQAVEEIEIERFSTTEGWRFPSNTEYLNAKIENNVCVILDDGSCTGDSLIQMIDEIAFYTAKEIILLCIIGRVNDHKREFFSRLEFIRVRNKKPVPISIYFASHWHIPTYYVDDNPLTKELIWLNEIIKVQNTPATIKKIAEVIIRDITPKTLPQFKNYKYLPKERVTKLPPVKDILLVREELGKVIGYRLYHESFRFFDFLTKKYTDTKYRKNRYKELELLSATFVYEPYIFEKVRNVMPDIVDKVKDFLSVLIFNYSAIEPLLNYEWEKTDIIHLFFIVFKNDDLVKQFEKDGLLKLIKFTGTTERDLNYILYKLLYYFTSSAHSTIEAGVKIKKVLLSVDADSTLPNRYRSRIKIYRWFISTLPSNNNFNDIIIRLKSNFEKIVDQQFHDENIYNDKQIISSLLFEIGKKIKKSESIKNEFILIQHHWEPIAMFIKDILSFSSKFPDFFIDKKIWNELEIDKGSLRTLFGELTNLIILENTDVATISNKIDELFVRFVLSESITLKIFSNPITTEANQILQFFLKRVSQTYSNNSIKGFITLQGTLDIPQYFLTLICKELFYNFRYADQKTPIRAYITKTPNKRVKIKLWNAINEDEVRKGGNTGERILKNINADLVNGYYRNYTRKGHYLQVIKFKII